MGVWIETIFQILECVLTMSHPSWVCGLKPLGGRAHGIWVRVTPFVGVWIETWVGIN